MSQESLLRRMSAHPVRFGFIALTASTALVLGGCSAGPDDGDGGAGAPEGSAVATIEKFNAMTGQARHDALVAAAQEEGVVVFYSTAPGWAPVLGAFSDEYDIEVEVFNGRSDTILQRVVQEFQAGLNAVDVFEDEAAQLLNSIEGATHVYKNDELTSQIPGYDESLGYVPFRLSVPVFAWNTDLVSDDEIPEDITDLTDPKWNGKITVDAGAWQWYSGIHDYLVDEKGYSDDQVTEFFEKIVSASSPQGSSIAMTELLIAGEYSAGISTLSQVVDRNTAKGAPIKWQTEDGRYMKPLIVIPEGGVLMANAPHPAAAMLLMDFILDQGAAVLKDGGTFINTAVPQEGGPLQNVAEGDLRLVDQQKITDDRDIWKGQYDDLILGK